MHQTRTQKKKNTDFLSTKFQPGKKKLTKIKILKKKYREKIGK